MAVIVGGIVDQHRHATEITDGRYAGGTQRLDVEKIHLIKQRGVSCTGVDATLNRRPGAGGIFVHKSDTAALAGELLNDRAANTLSAPGHKYRAINERGVAGVGGGHDHEVGFLKHRCS